MRRPILLAVMGPTASGKTGLAEEIAAELDAQLINADAFQAYRRMDIGTAKPEKRHLYELLDIKDPNEAYGVGEFVTRASSLLSELYHQGRSAVIVGGTGLYIRALMDEYSTMAEAPDPVLRAAYNQRLAEEGLNHLASELMEQAPQVAERTDLKNPVRVIRALERLSARMVPVQLPPFLRLKAAILPEAQELNARIEQRTYQMVQNGWVREVKLLADAGYSPDDPGFRAIGYRQIWAHLTGQVALEEATAATIAETRRYAKRQRTWLRSEANLFQLRQSDELSHLVQLVNALNLGSHQDGQGH